MFSAIALLALLPAVLAQLTVSTPASLVVCEPAALSWSGGTAPYYPSIIPGGQPGATALENFASQSGTSYTWPQVNIGAGTSITIQVRDSTGAVQYSSPITIASGPDSSCVGQSISGASTGSTAATASGSTVSTVSAATSTGASMTMMTTPTSMMSTGASSAVSKASGLSNSLSASASNVAASGSAAAASASASATKSGATSNFQAGMVTIASLAGLLGLAYLF